MSQPRLMSSLVTKHFHWSSSLRHSVAALALQEVFREDVNPIDAVSSLRIAATLDPFTTLSSADVVLKRFPRQWNEAAAVLREAWDESKATFAHKTISVVETLLTDLIPNEEAGLGVVRAEWAKNLLLLMLCIEPGISTIQPYLLKSRFKDVFCNYSADFLRYLPQQDHEAFYLRICLNILSTIDDSGIDADHFADRCFGLIQSIKPELGLKITKRLLATKML